MDRCTYIKIVGKRYPMSFSIGATKKIIARFGNTENMMKELKSKKEEEKKLEMVVEILELLIAQGCAYKNYFEADMPKPEDAPIIDGKWEPLPKEALEIALEIADVEEISEKITECINRGSKKEFELKETGKKEKATQEV